MANCCKYRLNAVSIVNDGDITTITVASHALEPIIATCGAEVQICINTSFDTCTKCARIVVTDGTTTLPIACKNQYWRPQSLICNSTLCTEFRNDPHLLVFKGGYKNV